MPFDVNIFTFLVQIHSNLLRINWKQNNNFLQKKNSHWSTSTHWKQWEMLYKYHPLSMNCMTNIQLYFVATFHNSKLTMVIFDVLCLTLKFVPITIQLQNYYEAIHVDAKVVLLAFKNVTKFNFKCTHINCHLNE